MNRQPPCPIYVFRGHEGSITALLIVKNIAGSISEEPSLISGSDKGEIFIWDFKTKRTYHRLKSHCDKMIVSLSYFNSSILSQGRDEMINEWNYDSNQWMVKRQITSPNTGFCASLLFPLNNEAYISHFNQNKINIQSFVTENIDYTFKLPSSAGMCMGLKVFQQEERVYLLAGYENGSVGLWDFETSMEKSNLKLHNEPVMCLDYDSKFKHRGISGSVDKELQIWEVTKNLQIVKVQEIQITNPGINAVRIRKDGKIVITAGWDCNIRLFSWKSLKPLVVLQFHSQPVQCLTMVESDDKNQSIFISGSKDKNIVFWSVY
ncbi:guanine nucleotide-binding protein subunit beta-like protein 1 [Uloborus diversus]|uniref:guanine nucleotide-binding protein subunit beta-like protein 1 n=1 Tax=Uloborus diversus TaxID=327109 RepID=UPI0024094915|nr:guanine nucleotide-binding protein subunit beta-like protein 1 [Uloborus diversus]